MDVRVLTLGNDASWGGWGWCLADQHAPRQVGHLALGPPNKRARKSKRDPNPPLLPTHRMARARAYLAGPLACVLADGQLLRAPTDPPVRVVTEVPPLGYKAGQASAYVNVGQLIGAIKLWGCRPTLGYPWVLEPGTWRGWWGIKPSRKGRGSEEIKADAIALVTRLWGPEWLEPFPLGAKRKGFTNLRKAGARGDVAEAILIAVGSSRHADEAPALPREWPETPVGRRYP